MLLLFFSSHIVIAALTERYDNTPATFQKTMHIEVRFFLPSCSRVSSLQDQKHINQRTCIDKQCPDVEFTSFSSCEFTGQSSLVWLVSRLFQKDSWSWQYNNKQHSTIQFSLCSISSLNRMMRTRHSWIIISWS